MPTPKELLGQDIYDIFYIFDNEREAIDYVVETYQINKEQLIEELYEEDTERNKYGKEYYLRGLQIRLDIYLSELMSGEYILWQSY